MRCLSGDFKLGHDPIFDILFVRGRGRFGTFFDINFMRGATSQFQFLRDKGLN